VLIGVGCLEDGCVRHYGLVGGGRLGVEVEDEAVAGGEDDGFV